MHALEHDNGEAAELRRVSNDQSGCADAGPCIAECAMKSEGEYAQRADEHVNQIQARSEKILKRPHNQYSF